MLVARTMVVPIAHLAGASVASSPSAVVWRGPAKSGSPPFSCE
jgi:hypothetical protein